MADDADADLRALLTHERFRSIRNTTGLVEVTIDDGTGHEMTLRGRLDVVARALAALRRTA